VAHRTIKARDLDIFYREAGPKDAPEVLLLHGFPTSSQMFRNVIPALADQYHLIAPDYPGYGHSSMPPRDQFSYTFDTLAKVIDEFTEKLGLTKYALYVQDYGAPVGYRLAVKHPERITALVVQNGNAYDEGLENDFWKPLKAYWKEPKGKEKRDALRKLLTYEATRTGSRPVPARPPRERRDPTRPVPQLRQQSAAVPGVAGVLPQAPAAGVDRLGEERPDLPGRRGRGLQARPEDVGVPSARRRPLRPGNEWRRDRQADTRVPWQACGQEVSPD
jgi:pimeloyl-ACP methyl ester carboxylesterase